jgi:hypothetical protein
MKNSIHSLAFLCLLILFLTSVATAQQCEVVRQDSSGAFIVKIDGKTYMAITADMARESLQTKADLEHARGIIGQKDELINSLQNVKSHYASVDSTRRAYVAELESIIKGYEKLVDGYKKLRAPWLTFTGGVGATGSDKSPAVLGGISIRRFQVWGYLQERNSGILVGTRFDIF